MSIEAGEEFSFFGGLTPFFQKTIQENSSQVVANFQEVTYTFMPELRFSLSANCWLASFAGYFALQPYPMECTSCEIVYKQDTYNLRCQLAIAHKKMHQVINFTVALTTHLVKISLT
jgi:hypothetical protein